LTTHCSESEEKPSPELIEGKATLTIETSRITMNCARHTTATRSPVDAGLVGGFRSAGMPDTVLE
jgi:hypothetical protein